MLRFFACFTLMTMLAACADPESEAQDTSGQPSMSANSQPDARAEAADASAQADARVGDATAPPGSSGPGAAADASAGSAGDAGSSTSREAGGGSLDDAGAPGPSGATSDTSTPEKPQLAVSADFLNQTLTIFDVDKLGEGKKRSDVVVGSVDLSKYSPGPLALNVTPDGKTALVSISAGFLGAFIDVPPGNGTLLFVDLESRAVVGELFTGKSPMGIVITQDGKRAFVGQYAESYFAVVDIEKRTFEKVPTGSQYNEELALDDTGSVGILTYGPSGNAKTFSVADPAGKIGQTLGLTGDAAGVAFFPGTKMAYLLQAPTALTLNAGGHNVVNVEDPTRPVASDNVRMGSAPTMYPVTAVPSRKTVVFPQTKDDTLTLIEMRLNGKVAEQAQSITVGAASNLAYGVASTNDARVLLAVPGDHYVGVVDLETKQAFTVPWEVTKSGPVDIKLIPRSN